MHDLLALWQYWCMVQQATACGLPEVFHVSPRSRSIARRSSPVVRSCQRSIGSVSTTSKRRHMAWCCVYMQVNETGHAERLNMLKQRPRKWFFREDVDFLSSLAFVVNGSAVIRSTSSKSKRSDFHSCWVSRAR